ncbi:hypothetical protein AVEN_230219-1 [Araneus ventricosus]|uniref:Uncharacterized protein n=1 Tax=Araneus ventricosus TaxID=182803 RepID=A0A4Y2DUQ6_ARAVE|nr:hypothetical protein AVEN_230219-1 [Araneus ventricosus]
MNIIEGIRDALLHVVEKRSPPPRTPMDLLTALQDSWCEFPSGYLQTPVESMPRRFASLLRAHGARHDIKKVQRGRIDLLAKRTTTKSVPSYYPAPQRFLRREIMNIPLGKCQKEWDVGLTGKIMRKFFQKSDSYQPHGKDMKFCLHDSFKIRFVSEYDLIPKYFESFSLSSANELNWRSTFGICQVTVNLLRYKTTITKKELPPPSSSDWGHVNRYENRRWTPNVDLSPRPNNSSRRHVPSSEWM